MKKDLLHTWLILSLMFLVNSFASGDQPPLPSVPTTAAPISAPQTPVSTPTARAATQTPASTTPATVQTPLAQTPSSPSDRLLIPVHDCTLTAVIPTNLYSVTCVRYGSVDQASWDSSPWQPSERTKKEVPASVWAACSWLGDFGYNEIVSTPDLGHHRSLGMVTRAKNTYEYDHGYEIGGGRVTIFLSGNYCPEFGKNIDPPPRTGDSFFSLFTS